MITKDFLKKKVFIVAEIGNNHEGDLERCLSLIDKAVECGVDAVKFQTFEPTLYYSVDQKDRINQLEKFQIQKEDFIKIKRYCDKRNVVFFSTPFDIESAIFLNSIQPIFKISSGDNNFFELIDKVMSFNKPLFISTGLTDETHIKSIYKRVKKKWKKTNNSKFLVFLHCIASYPVIPREANLNAITSLKDMFKDVIVGYSDHCEGVQASILSVALGAKVVEKHFTDDKNFSNFRDHKISADPMEMKQLVNMVRNTEILIGGGKLEVSESEKKNLKQLRRSIAVNKKCLKNSKILEKDLIWLRPADGLIEKKKILGKSLIKDLKYGEKIYLKDIRK